MLDWAGVKTFIRVIFIVFLLHFPLINVAFISSSHGKGWRWETSLLQWHSFFACYLAAVCVNKKG